jgi:hypothetical protein
MIVMRYIKKHKVDIAITIVAITIIIGAIDNFWEQTTYCTTSFNPDYRGYVGLVLGVSGTGIILLLLSRYKYEDNTSEVKK